jgi:hypothetical protein
MSDICIIGAGATGLLLLLLLREENVSIIDPNFDGGDLARRWTAVQSNTPWSKSLNALKAAFPTLEITSPLDPQATSSLASIAEIIRNLARPVLKKISHTRGTVSRCKYSTEDCLWTIEICSGNDILKTTSKKIVFTQGSEPTTLDLPIPSIPLDIAMDYSRLKHYVKADEKVLVFGTKHSGTLVIKNLYDLSANVVALYKSERPFYYDREGVYDGIKAEAAVIADDIVAGKISANLVHVNDVAKLIRASSTADWVVYAMGFTPRRDIRITVDGVDKSVTAYNDSTGQLLEVPRAWGFGIAYPKRAPDGIHFDVSIAAFLDHMKSQLDTLCQQ